MHACVHGDDLRRQWPSVQGAEPCERQARRTSLVSNHMR